MVGGQYGNHRRRAAPRRHLRRHRNGRAAVAAHGLEHNFAPDTHLLHLLAHPEAVIMVGDDQRRVKLGIVAQYGEQRLKGRALANQRDELLGQALARFRPHPRARAAAHDNGENFGHGCPGNENLGQDSCCVVPKSFAACLDCCCSQRMDNSLHPSAGQLRLEMRCSNAKKE